METVKKVRNSYKLKKSCCEGYIEINDRCHGKF